MKKLIFITLILSLMLAMSAFGSNTRTLTMGNNNMILVDDANIWMFPSRINDYPGLAIAEIGSGDVTQFGVHWKLGDEKSWVLATYFDNMGPMSPAVFVPFDNALLDNRRIHLFYGRTMSSTNFGLRFSVTQSGQELVGSYNESFSYYLLNAGLTADDGSWDIAISFGLGDWTDETGAGITETSPDGYSDFILEGRMFWDQGPNYTYVPHASIEFHKIGIQFDVVSVPTSLDKFSTFVFDLGIGQIYTPSNNVEAVLDFGIRFNRLKFEDIDLLDATNNAESNFNTTSIFYFKLGLDAEVFSWMDVRFGATSFWNRFKQENGIDFKTSSAANDTFLGFGFHWGNFHVDTYADPQLFLEGFNFISGGNQNMNFQISAVYEML